MSEEGACEASVGGVIRYMDKRHVILLSLRSSRPSFHIKSHLPGCDRLVKKTTNHLPTAAVILNRMKMALSNLAENLSFAYDQRIQSPGNTEKVPDSVVTTESKNVLA